MKCYLPEGVRWKQIAPLPLAAEVMRGNKHLKNIQIL
jgi:hypothetical protein